MEHDEKGKVIIPESVENLFSLMDFAKDGAICESEFIKTTKHYRFTHFISFTKQLSIRESRVRVAEISENISLSSCWRTAGEACRPWSRQPW